MNIDPGCVVSPRPSARVKFKVESERLWECRLNSMNTKSLDIISSAPGIKVLLIDHNSGSLSRIHELLSASDLLGFSLDCVTSLGAATNKFHGNTHDVCLIDSGHAAVDFLEQARRVGCCVPIIVLTSSYGDEVIEAFRAGASDCLIRE